MQEVSGSISGVSSVPSTFSAIASRRVRFRPLAPADSGLHQRNGREGGGIGRCQYSVFSGVCARNGGLSTAIEKGVPEEIVWMQSGHAYSPAALRYVVLNSPVLLYSTWEAFKL
jgi:hypothetical protein